MIFAWINASCFGCLINTHVTPYSGSDIQFSHCLKRILQNVRPIVCSTFCCLPFSTVNGIDFLVLDRSKLYGVFTELSVKQLVQLTILYLFQAILVISVTQLHQALQHFQMYRNLECCVLPCTVSNLYIHKV